MPATSPLIPIGDWGGQADFMLAKNLFFHGHLLLVILYSVTM